MKFFLEIPENSFATDVEIDPRHTVKDLEQMLARYSGVPRVTSIAVRTADSGLRNLNPESIIERSGLVAGDTIVLNHPVSEGTSSGQRVGRLCLGVAAGMDSGIVIDLTPGDFTVGRHRSQTLVLSDPQVSLRDFALKVDTGEKVVLDPGVERSNPVRVNRELAEEPTGIGGGDVIHVGPQRLWSAAHGPAGADRPTTSKNGDTMSKKNIRPSSPVQICQFRLSGRVTRTGNQHSIWFDKLAVRHD